MIVPGRWHYFQVALEPESHQAIDEHCVNSRAKALWDNTWKTNPSNGVSRSGFDVALNPDIYMTLTLNVPWISDDALK